MTHIPSRTLQEPRFELRSIHTKEKGEIKVLCVTGFYVTKSNSGREHRNRVFTKEVVNIHEVPDNSGRLILQTKGRRTWLLKEMPC